MNAITKQISIEQLVDQVPGAVKYLMEKGVKCIACGEPVWGTLEENAKLKGFTDEQINTFVNDLNTMRV